ncbi:MAG: hypothetical protein JXA11_09515 [Phycisphaerae bacterium]|nr:hypothetical protein [Phycisphaerae bacterium]
MNRIVHGLVWFLAAAGVGGCVTAHEARTKLEILDNANHRIVNDCILLTIRMESLETQGHWFVAQEEKAGHMLPVEASICTMNSGDMLDQEGKIIVTVGPYARGKTLGVEYWLFRPGYQPDDFLNEHVERAYEDKTDLDLHLLREDPGSSISDEKVLDGARRVLDMLEFLDPNDPNGTRLVTLLIEQVENVKEHAYKPKWQKQSRDMLPKLREALKRFPNVKAAWKGLPRKTAEESKSEVAAAGPAPKPSAIQKPSVEIDTPSEKPAETSEEEPVAPTASSDLPMTPSTESEEDDSSPQLEAVDLSELDNETAETQPAAQSGDDAVEHNLTPIRK